MEGALARSPDTVLSRNVLRIGDRVVPPQLDEALVQGMCDEIVVMPAWPEGSIEVRLELQAGAHPSQLEIAQPQFSVGERGILTKRIKHVIRAIPAIVVRHRRHRDWTG